MSGNTFGRILRLTSCGESHGPALAGILEGVPAGLAIDPDFLRRELERRRPGQSAMTTARSETDEVELLSGVFEGRATGAPIGLLIRNAGQHSADYGELAQLYRPGHADYTWDAKYGFRDWRGGGRASGRETAIRVAAGAIAKLLLREYRVCVTAGALSIGGVRAQKIDFGIVDGNPVRALDPDMAPAMEREIARARAELDSTGGEILCRITGVPAGWGEPVFDKLDALLAHAMLSLGAVKGISFGAPELSRGSRNNDEFTPEGLATNRCGGILGGISAGSPVEFTLTVKPTPSIAQEQRTVDRTGIPRTIAVHGRHDPCIVPRLVSVVEAMAALVLADAALMQRTARLEN